MDHEYIYSVGMSDMQRTYVPSCSILRNFFNDFSVFFVSYCLSCCAQTVFPIMVRAKAYQDDSSLVGRGREMSTRLAALAASLMCLCPGERVLALLIRLFLPGCLASALRSGARMRTSLLPEHTRHGLKNSAPLHLGGHRRGKGIRSHCQYSTAS